MLRRFIAGRSCLRSATCHYEQLMLNMAGCENGLVSLASTASDVAQTTSIWRSMGYERRMFAGNDTPKRVYADMSVFHRILPPFVHPYIELMRLHKFSATWLLALPCFWSTALAAPPGSFPDIRLLGLFGVGATIMRSAGCIVNDMWDVDLDRQVERTKIRPLASNQLSMAQSITLLGGHGIAGLAILLQLNDYSKLLGFCSVPLVCSYPLMKRVTNWPQLYLGMTINWGALMGWPAVKGVIDWNVVLPLYVSGICWTLIYDTIYACQDKKDDKIVGVRSTALLFGKNIKLWLSGFAVCQISCLVLTGAAADCGMLYYSSVFLTGGHLFWQITTVDVKSPQDCSKKFVSNKWIGLVLFCGITLDKVTQCTIQ